MKKYIFCFTMFIFAICTTGKCQGIRNAEIRTNKNADLLAQYMTQKMKDSLGLTQKQADEVYKVNMKIYERKSKARKQIQDRALLTRAIQKIENERDDMYLKILPSSSLQLYKNRKNKIVSGS
jgi:hypothetical protein